LPRTQPTICAESPASTAWLQTLARPRSCRDDS
jgi:hypothetical protein